MHNKSAVGCQIKIFEHISTVIRCPRIPHVNDGYYHCYPVSDDTVYGSVCRFGCYGGHSLTGGKSEVTCTKSGKWSGALPKCQSNFQILVFIWSDKLTGTFYEILKLLVRTLFVEHTCPVLLRTDLLLQFTCTNGNEFRSICTYSCPYGYEIKSGMSRVRVCTQGGWWSGSVPSCIGKCFLWFLESKGNTWIYMDVFLLFWALWLVTQLNVELVGETVIFS